MCQVMQPQMKNFEHQDLYDFLFDRLRSVRQDLVVQSAPDDVQLHILATCVRFHLVFGHLLAQHSTFSQHLNSQHQLECLKSCLVLGETSSSSSSSSSSRSQEESDMETMQCLYLLTNLDSPHALNWAVNTQTRSEKLGNVSIYFCTCCLINQFCKCKPFSFYREMFPTCIELQRRKFCEVFQICLIFANVTVDISL